MRFSVGKGGGGEEGLLDRIESTELNIEAFAVDGLVLNWLKRNEVVRGGVAVDRQELEPLMAVVRGRALGLKPAAFAMGVLMSLA